MHLTNVFKKQGGFSLIKKYVHNHVLFYAFFVFMLIPKNTKGLELFREYMNLKIYLRIKQKNRKIIENFLSKTSIGAQSFYKPKVIWFCWLQGLEKAPILVKKCYESIKNHCEDYEIRVVTSENFFEWTDIPDFIIKKWRLGIISHTHFSDILRTALLVKNGGTWIDSTVLFSGKIPSAIEIAPLFMFRTYKPGSDGKATTLSSWFISSCSDNPVLSLVQQLIFEYWKKPNCLCDYCLFHIFMQIALDAMPKIASCIPKYTNETPHLMLFELENEFNQEKWNSITSQSFCHKLTNKLDESIKIRKKTVYEHILEKNI